MPTVVSLFCGAGGFDLGFKNAGYDLLYACDNDQDCIDTYNANIGDHARREDVRKLSSASVPRCDVLIGGPPCQGFSVAGKMDPDDPRSSLVWHFVRIVSDLKPKAFVMENVKALAWLSRWESVRIAFCKEFSRIGYEVSMNVLNAKDYGVPQSRERVFFVGLLGEALTISPRKTKTKTARETLLSLPEPGTAPNLGVCNAKITPARKPILRKSPYAGMLFNGQGRPINLSSVSNTVPASMGGNRTPIIDENELRLGTPPWTVDYHARLVSGEQPLAEVPKFLRRLTVTEASLLQSFPVGYQFKGKQSSQYRQIGNAVPPPLAEAIAKSLSFS